MQNNFKNSKRQKTTNNKLKVLNFLYLVFYIFLEIVIWNLELFFS